jgi:hypothetical protein
MASSATGPTAAEIDTFRYWMQTQRFCPVEGTIDPWLLPDLRCALDTGRAAGSHRALSGAGMIGALALPGTQTSPGVLAAMDDGNQAMPGEVRLGHTVRYSSAIKGDGTRYFGIAAKICKHVSIVARIHGLVERGACIYPVSALAHGVS